jgi:hypothetical protein
MVDLIHAADDGNRWAFVAFNDGWIAVNTKYAESTADGHDRHCAHRTENADGQGSEA